METNICDGKKCGKGKNIGGGHYLCPHNNLKAKYPHLIDEWHSDNDPMENFSPSTLKKVWWICLGPKNLCGCHVYEASIANRTKLINPSGCPYCCHRKLCPHNNLEFMHPELKNEWHPDNPKLMKDYPPNSNEKVLWKCSKNDTCDCHSWKAVISGRTRPGKQSGCPFCYNKPCKHANLEVLFPHLIKEWHPDNPKSMRDYPPCSNEKAWWKCSKNNICECHVYEAVINGRTRQEKPSGCPFCIGRKLCPHNNLKAMFLDLVKEWHPDNDPMEGYTMHSKERVKWICFENQIHIWEVAICERTKNYSPSGCPFCVNRKVCPDYNLKLVFPDLIKEWHPDNEPMDTYPPYSSEKVWWVCSKNQICRCHIWKAQIGNRTSSNYLGGCPFCLNKKLCDHNNLEAIFPELKNEWHPDNKPMNTYSPRSSKRVKWICYKNNKHIWITSIGNRTAQYRSSRWGGTNCPHCSKAKGYSDAQINWLKKIEVDNDIVIQHALSEEREFYIPEIGKVDGWHELTYTIYEFHGDYWHGNPSVYKSTDINKRTKESYGELYQKTIEKRRTY